MARRASGAQPHCSPPCAPCTAPESRIMTCGRRTCSSPLTALASARSTPRCRPPAN
jgi:hypothetical protein